MPRVDFDDSDFQEDGEDAYAQDVEEMFSNIGRRPSPATPVPANVEKEAEAEEEDVPIEVLTEVERRLELARYYRMLLSGGLFSGHSAVGRQVELEVRGFVNQRLQVLLGISAEGQVAQEGGFSAEEVKVLKAVAKGLLKKKEPTLNRTRPPPVTPEPTLKPVAEPEKPKLKQRKPEPDLTPVAPAPVRGAPDPSPTNRKQRKALAVGDIIKDGNKTYEVVMLDGKLFPKDITGQSVSKDKKPIPMPTGPAMTATTMARAGEEARLVGEQVAKTTGNGRAVGNMVAQALQQVAHREDDILLNP